jgi:predicted enzyme related to lactoylglutathione lyase
MFPTGLQRQERNMNQFNPENAAVWFEIPVTDLGKASRFYEAVTTLTLKQVASGPNPTAIFPAKKSGVAGHLYPGKPQKDGGNTIHLAVPAPLETALERVTKNGGKVLSEVVKIPEGRFAYCLDPDGNSVGFFTHD